MRVLIESEVVYLIILLDDSETGEIAVAAEAVALLYAGEEERYRGS